jgi:hypothetical protein
LHGYRAGDTLFTPSLANVQISSNLHSKIHRIIMSIDYFITGSTWLCVRVNKKNNKKTRRENGKKNLAQDTVFSKSECRKERKRKKLGQA